MRALALLVVNDVHRNACVARHQPPPRALTLPRKPYARDLLYFHHGLLSMPLNEMADNRVAALTVHIPADIFKRKSGFSL